MKLRHVIAMIWVKGGENSSKRRENWSAQLSIKWASKSMIKFQSEKLVKSETPSFIFARVWLEGVQIAQTIANVGMHVFISNGHPNL